MESDQQIGIEEGGVDHELEAMVDGNLLDDHHEPFPTYSTDTSEEQSFLVRLFDISLLLFMFCQLQMTLVIIP